MWYNSEQSTGWRQRSPAAALTDSKVLITHPKCHPAVIILVQIAVGEESEWSEGLDPPLLLNYQRGRSNTFYQQQRADTKIERNPSFPPSSPFHSYTMFSGYEWNGVIGWASNSTTSHGSERVERKCYLMRFILTRSISVCPHTTTITHTQPL